MMYLWITALVAPGLLALLVLGPRAIRPAVELLAPWAALPAVLLALLADDDSTTSISWLLLGMRLGLDVTGQVFLLVTAIVWLAAGLFARGYMRGDERSGRFWFFFLLSMSGNLGLMVALDVVTFYVAFALMTFAAYGLVIHRDTQQALRAGRVYLIMSLVGEMCILAGMLFIVQSAGSLDLRIVPGAVAVADHRNLIVALILVGFGVKVGALPLHMWLPLAYRAAPIPASAALSGCMINAGLLGWVRFLPLDDTPLEVWGGIVISMGLLAAFLGVVAGLLQDDPKTVLAYSSISQMGLITVAVGIGLIGTDSWDLAQAAIIVFVLHHSLAKGALFLGVGVAGSATGSRWQSRLALVGLAIAALALSGAPLTSGALAKTALKDASHMAHTTYVDVLLPITSIGTTVLMVRFMLLLHARLAVHAPSQRFQPWLWLPWTTLVLLIGAIGWMLPWYVDLEIADPTVITLAKVWSSLWPVLIGIVLAGGTVYALRRRVIPLTGRLPAGDLIVVVERLVRALPGALPHRSEDQRRWAKLVNRFQVKRPLLGSIETELARWRTVGIVMMSLILVFLFVLGFQ